MEDNLVLNKTFDINQKQDYLSILKYISIFVSKLKEK